MCSRVKELIMIKKINAIKNVNAGKIMQTGDANIHFIFHLLRLTS